MWRLLTAPEPLIPVAILLDPIVRWSVLASALGWAAIVGLNIFLPMYLQSVLGFSPTDAGLSLMVLMMSLNTSAGLAGQVLGRVQHYKILPICMMVIALAAMTMLAVWVGPHDLRLVRNAAVPDRRGLRAAAVAVPGRDAEPDRAASARHRDRHDELLPATCAPP